jgi:branched-chain amino acid aminotransferase
MGGSLPQTTSATFTMSMADRDGVIWYDGKLVPWRDATTHVLTHTLHYGMGVFEGVRAYKAEQGTAIFRLKEHTDRLFRSAHILGMKTAVRQGHDLRSAAHRGARERSSSPATCARWRSYGSEAMGISAKNLSVHVIVAAWPWGTYLGQEALERGIRVKTSSFSRHHVNITMCKAKANGNYMNSILAHKEAEMDGYDEALLLDVDGYRLRRLGRERLHHPQRQALHPRPHQRPGRPHPRHHHSTG